MLQHLLYLYLLVPVTFPTHSTFTGSTDSGSSCESLGIKGNAWTSFQHGCYLYTLVDQVDSWQEANHTCVYDHQAELVSVLHEPESKFLWSMLNAAHPDSCKNDTSDSRFVKCSTYVAIGLHRLRRMSSGSSTNVEYPGWRWSDHSPVNFTADWFDANAQGISVETARGLGLPLDQPDLRVCEGAAACCGVYMYMTRIRFGAMYKEYRGWLVDDCLHPMSIASKQQVMQHHIG